MSPPGRAPLAGVRIVVTRAEEQAGGLAAALEALGAEVVRFPVIRIAPPADPGPLLRAAAQVGAYDWVVFTSVNAVERFWQALDEAGSDAGALGRVRIFAIGDATAGALAARGARVDLVPEAFVTESAVQALLRAGDLRGRRILLPRAAVARPLLPQALRAAGAEVEEVEAYRTERHGEGAGGVRALLAAGGVDLVAFTSGSTVRAFVELVGRPEGIRVVTIGPVTTRAAEAMGVRVDAEAGVHTVGGLVEAVRELYTQGE